MTVLNCKEGDNIGRILIIEFSEQDSDTYNEVMEVLKCYFDFENLQLKDEPRLSVPGLEIYPSHRKICHRNKEINLTAKEYDLFCLLVINKGRILTYDQIYQKIWGRRFMEMQTMP